MAKVEVSGTAVLVGVGVIAAGALLWWVSRKGIKGVAAAAVGAAGDAAAGAVVGVGNLVGIPATNYSQGVQDLMAGDWWDASFNLPAGDFLGAAWDSLLGRDPVAGLTNGQQHKPAPTAPAAASLATDFNYSSWEYGFGA